MTRSGEPPTVTPSQVVTGALADQFSVPVPTKVSRAVSSRAQSVARPGLFEQRTIGGSTANPWPQVLFGSGCSRWIARLFRYSATSTGPNSGNRCRTNAAIPATWGDAWLVPQNPSLYSFRGRSAVSPQSAPTMSGLGSIRPSGVGPRLLKGSIVLVSYQGAAPTASIPGLALSAGLTMLPLSV